MHCRISTTVVDYVYLSTEFDRWIDYIAHFDCEYFKKYFCQRATVTRVIGVSFMAIVSFW